MDRKYDVLLGSLPKHAQKEILDILADLEENTKKLIDNVERLKNPHYNLLQYIDGIRRNTVVVGDIQQPLREASAHSEKVFELLDDERKKDK